MQIHYFNISVHDPEPGSTELNQLLASHLNAIVKSVRKRYGNT